MIDFTGLNDVCWTPLELTRGYEGGHPLRHFRAKRPINLIFSADDL
jgi:hypothetical protein